MKNLFMISIILFSINIGAQSFIDPKTNKIQVTPAAKITLLKGEAFKTPFSNQKASTPVQMGEELIAGDKLKVGEKSILKLEMTDDTVITLGPKTTFEIVLYNFETKTKRNSTLKLIEGHLRSEVKQPAEKNELTYQLGRVAMGIRGTQFVAEVLKSGSEDITRVSLIEGKAFLDLTNSGHKTLKSLSLDTGKIFLTKNLTPEAKEETLLVTLPPDHLNRLTKPEGSDGATFLKDLDQKLDKKSLQESVNQALSTNQTSSNEKASEEKEKEQDEVPRLKKKKKAWSEILEEDQNTKDNP
jgi:hypothetical protein